MSMSKKIGKSRLFSIGTTTTMSPTTALLIMLNNYFHDVATALLMAGGIAMWIIASRLGDKPSP